MRKLVQMMQHISDIRYILVREYGQIPENKDIRREQIEEDREAKNPYVEDETTREDTKTYNFLTLINRTAKQGHISNSGSNKFKIRFYDGDRWSNYYTMSEGEVIELSKSDIQKLEFRPYEEGQEYTYKYILS